MLNRQDIISLRMKRQYLEAPVTRDNYDQLFTDMSPVPTQYWTRPGDPPTLPKHADFDDYDYNSRRRARRSLLKGRFAGGTIAYVTQEDLELFACLYRKELPGYSSVQEEIIRLFQQEGPMNIQLIKELTGLLVKGITPELHKLQEAFLVYEDQLDNEWDRGWYLFESEFPEVDLKRYTKKEALKIALPRAARLLVFFDGLMLKSYYRLPLKLLQEVTGELVAEGRLALFELEGKAGYLLREDREHLEKNEVEPTKPKVMLLQRNDFLVRAYADSLKNAFPSEWDALYYLLVDGEFRGAVTGRFTFGPPVVEDIILDLPEAEKENRREEILEAVYEVFDRELSKAKRYCGKPVI